MLKVMMNKVRAMQSQSLKQSLKEELATMVQGLSEDCSIEDVRYRLYLMSKVRRGKECLANEGGISQAEAEKRLGKWITK